MKKVLKITGIILIVIVIFLAVFVALNWDKIMIIKNAVMNTYTDKDIEELEKKNYEALNNAAGILDIELTPLTDEEKQALEEGKITEDDARKIIMGQMVYLDGKAVENNGSKAAAADKSAEIISQIYVLEASYKSQLKSIEHDMLVSYNQLPSSEKTTVNKYKLANSAMSQGTALKAECDAKMEALLSQLEQNLKECGKDTAIVSQIRSAYANEKNTVQAYYLSKYSSR